MVFTGETDSIFLVRQSKIRSEGGPTYKITKKRGRIAGLGVSVSGSGAWVKMEGSMNFKISALESSQSYSEMVKKHKINKGVGGFFGFIGFGNNSSKYESELTTVFDEVKTSQETDGTVKVDMYVSGQYPNVQVTASAYLQVMQVEDNQGNAFYVAAEGGPDDVAAQDANGNNLPTDQNESTVDLGFSR